MKTRLVQAAHDTDRARYSLREALKDCTSVEGILILSMIEQATTLERRIEELLNAKEVDRAGAK